MSRTTRADQITMECMDCGGRKIGARPQDAPAKADLYVAHCGCPSRTAGAPYYLDAEGNRLKPAPGELEEPSD